MKLSKIKRYIVDSGYRFSVNDSHGFYDSLSDEKYLKKKYFSKFHKHLDLENPISLNEKLQWLKLNDRKPLYTQLVDKIEAKDIVSKVIGAEYIIPTIGVWDSFSEINFSNFPNQFVLKCSHDSGGLIICRDKSGFDINYAKDLINSSLNRNYYDVGREWPYKDVKPRIFAEKYMEENPSVNGGSKGLTDYKFFCFNGSPLLLYVSRGLEYHPTAEISFYGMDGIEKEFHRSDYKPYHNAKMPSNFPEMKITAEKLAKFVDCPFVRIDLYSINNKIYFSEITFSPCSGFIPFEPMSTDVELGKLLDIPQSK